MAKGYEINEKDIKGAINFLKYTDPEHATPEMAIELLEYLQKNYHTLAHTDLNKLTEIYNELKETKKSRN
jgi:hypothetical protein